MSRQVVIIQEAEDDLYDIYRYIQLKESTDRAIFVLKKLQATCLSLDVLAGRGHIVSELERIGVSEFKEIHFKPYRVIYEYDDETVFIHAVLDGRRDIRDLLERRIFR